MVTRLREWVRRQVAAVAADSDRLRYVEILERRGISIEAFAKARFFELSRSGVLYAVTRGGDPPTLSTGLGIVENPQLRPSEADQWAEVLREQLDALGLGAHFDAVRPVVRAAYMGGRVDQIHEQMRRQGTSIDPAVLAQLRAEQESC